MLQLTEQLEELRALLFTGKSRRSLPPLTHPAYVAWFEDRIERDPAAEWQALRQYAQSIVPLYRKQLADKHRMEGYFQGDATPSPEYDDATVLEKLYEEIMELETEDEWQTWVRHWTLMRYNK